MATSSIFKAQYNAETVRLLLQEVSQAPTALPTDPINLSIAENILTIDKMMERLYDPSNPQLPYDQHNYGNNEYFKESLTKFLGATFFAGRTLETKHLIIANGAGPVLNMLVDTLCQPGEGIIIPSPYYATFNSILSMRAKVEPIPAYFQPSNNFAWDISKLDEALASAKVKCHVKALLLTSPNNPMGTIYPKEVLIEAVHWAKSKNLHLIMDEIYAQCIYDETKKFVSISDVLKELNIGFGNDIHVVWSFSKDFPLSGFRVGFLYTECPELLECMQELVRFIIFFFYYIFRQFFFSL